MGDPEQFLDERRLLFAIAYRMLGSAADADDVLQDAIIPRSPPCWAAASSQPGR